LLLLGERLAASSAANSTPKRECPDLKHQDRPIRHAVSHVCFAVFTAAFDPGPGVPSRSSRRLDAPPRAATARRLQVVEPPAL